MRPRLLLVAVLPAALALSGCASGPGRGAAGGAARSFVRALEAGNGAAACRLLTDDARRSASGATSTPCARAILSIKEQGATVRGVQVWGDAAQVRVADDVLFLRHVGGKWLIGAAGCKPQPPGPYDCSVGS